jgi:crotonobetainyl-CoA:carnitine CoA-transferase CaiB-like acyl-CoA transferase
VHQAQVYTFLGGDGLPFVVHLSSPPKFWEGLTRAVEQPELQHDPRFETKDRRREHYDELHAILAGIFRQAPRSFWLDRLREHDVPSAPLYTLDEVFADPHIRHLGMVEEVEHIELGTVRLTRSGVRLSETPPAVRTAPPVLGQHSAEILSELGYSAEEVDALCRHGAEAVRSGEARAT